MQASKQAALDRLSGRFKTTFSLGKFDEALSLALQAIEIAPQIAVPRTDAAVCLSRLGRWKEAIEHAHKAYELDPQSIGTLDALAHAHGILGDWESVRLWGLRALENRVRQFAGPKPLPQHAGPLPPPPAAATRRYNLIAFSLFGTSPKYCETAVLNAVERGRVYPDWTCRFYVDGSVPAHVLERLEGAGAEIIRVEEKARQWPGPMWRFLAADSPGLHRAIFRDADSIISEREALAVTEWVESNSRFHHMRDACSHTELLMAGMWGCVGGALPPITALVERFLEKPIASTHFADQYFLREFVWPYARESLLQHDSLFGFADFRPFPDGPRSDAFHVGGNEGAMAFSMGSPYPDGTTVRWSIYSKLPEARLICTYPGVSEGGRIKANLPRRMVRALASGDLVARIDKAPA